MSDLDVIYLADRDNPDKVVAHACKTCRFVRCNEADADRCCRCKECGTLLPMPHDRRRRIGFCSQECEKAECTRRDLEWNKKQAEARAKRPRVHWEEVKSPVSNDGDNYFESIDEFVDDYLDQLESPEDFSLQPIATTCKVVPAHLDVGDALENAFERGEYHEGAYWSHEDELEAFVAEWNKKQTSSTWWANNDLIDWTGYPWLDHCPADCESWAPLRAEIERQLAEEARKEAQGVASGTPS
jgi:hypothetical protein